METFCGACCDNCGNKENCKGCVATGGSPFGGRCIAAEYIKAHGRESYAEFKQELLCKVNTLLSRNGIPEATALYELPGFYVNLAYPLPSGETVKFLNDKNIYLGAQIEGAGNGRCYGVVADESFVLVCSYGDGGKEPELLLYKSNK